MDKTSAIEDTKIHIIQILFRIHERVQNPVLKNRERRAIDKIASHEKCIPPRSEEKYYGDGLEGQGYMFQQDGDSFFQQHCSVVVECEHMMFGE